MIVALFWLIPLIFVVCDLLGSFDIPLRPAIFVLLIGVGVEAALVVRYCTRRVALGADGITYTVAGRRPQHIPWREVAAWKNDFHGIRIDTHAGTHLRFKPAELAFGSRIAGLIEEHLRDVRAAKESGATATGLSAADR